MRVLLVSSGVPPYADGEAERSAFGLARALALEDQVDLVAPRTSADQPAEETRDGVRIHALPPARGALLASTFHHRAHRRRFDRLVRRLRPEVAHVHHASVLSGALLEVLAVRQVPFFVHLHDYWFLCPRRQLVRGDGRVCETGPRDGGECVGCCADGGAVEPLDPLALRRESFWLGDGGVRLLGVWHELLDTIAPGTLESTAAARRMNALALLQRARYLRSSLERAEALLAPSEFVRQRFLREGFPSELVRRVDTGVEPEAGPTREPAPGVRFAFAGELSSRSGVETLIEAFSGLAGVDAGLTLYGRGDGPAAERIRTAAGRAGIVLREPLSEDGYGAAFARTDALVVPVEAPVASCRLAHEALQASVPVIATRSGALPEIVHDGVNGLLFGAGDALGLRLRLERLCRDRGLLRLLRSGARSGVAGGRSAFAEHAATMRQLYVEAIRRREESEWALAMG